LWSARNLRVRINGHNPLIMGVIAKSMTSTILIAATLFSGQLTADQQLVVACHRLDVDAVTEMLRNGANVNARFGRGDRSLFKDKWSLGTPMASSKWTPLIALANALPYPDPPRVIKSTTADLNWARDQLRKIPKGEIEARKQRQLTILHILLSHKCDLDAGDGYGATALYDAIYAKREEFVLALLRYKPKVNIKVGIYIDGTGDITPLHRAYWSVKITEKLLKMGADSAAKDGAGRTSRDWASDNPKVAALYDSR